jgi:hypothetical protein
MNEIIEIIETVRKKRDEWICLESNYRKSFNDFDCAVYVNEDHWRRIMRGIANRRGMMPSELNAFYVDSTLLGFPVYVAYSKGREDHPPFCICVTS